MLEDETNRNFWRWVDTNFVQPEIEQRRQLGQLDDKFKIEQFRVLMPKNQPPIVEFNNEVGWLAKAKRGDGKDFVPEIHVYLHELDRIEYVYPPKVEDKRVAFIFFAWDGHQYQGYFDFSPNWPQEKLIAHDLTDDENWPPSDAITLLLQNRLEQRSAQFCMAHKEKLENIGLWLVPILIPYPLANIVQHLINKDELSARNLLTLHCDSDFLDKLVVNWLKIDEFKYRQLLLEESLWAHSSGKYHLSISTLLPQIEGVIVDWQLNRGMNAKFRTESRIKDFSLKTKGHEKTPYLYSSVHKTAVDFILTGPVLETFQSWQQKLNPNFPNRHAIGHGRYEKSFFNEEISIKVFLLLDTVKQLIAAQNEELQQKSNPHDTVL